MGRVVVGMLVVVAAIGCASTGASTEESEAHELLRLAGSLEANPPRDGSEAFVVDTISASPSRVFTAVRLSYEEIGIPFSFYEAEQLRLGGFVRELGDIGDERPSTWVNCGRGLGISEYADAYEVSLAVGTRVIPIDLQTSAIETVVRARARARDVSSDLLRCSSLGTFETSIAEGVRERIGR